LLLLKLQPLELLPRPKPLALVELLPLAELRPLLLPTSQVQTGPPLPSHFLHLVDSSLASEGPAPGTHPPS
jgi:hypothetical protein